MLKSNELFTTHIAGLAETTPPLTDGCCTWRSRTLQWRQWQHGGDQQNPVYKLILKQRLN